MESNELHENPYRDAWKVAVMSYLDQFSDGEEAYLTVPSFHYAVYQAAEVVVRLLYMHPEGPPLSELDHIVRRVRMTSQAAIIEQSGQFDATTLLQSGWTWQEGEEVAFGKRIRWLVPPATQEVSR